MKSYVSTNSLSIILLFGLCISVYCDAATIIASIEQKAQQKQGFVTEKNGLFINLKYLQNDLNIRFTTDLQARSAALSAYGPYFNEKARCEGLDTELEFIGLISSLPEDFCMESPVNSQAYQVFIQKIQLAYKTDQRQLAQKLVNQQAAFNADVMDQLAVYTRFREISYIPLQAAVKNYQDCMKNHSSPSNPNPPQCDPLNAKISEKEAFYGYYRGNQVTFGMSTKTPVFSLQIKQNTSAALQKEENDFKAQLQPQITQVKSLSDSCYAGLANYKTLADTRLQAALDSTNEVSNSQTTIQNALSSLNQFITVVEGVTNDIKSNSTQLKQLLP